MTIDRPDRRRPAGIGPRRHSLRSLSAHAQPAHDRRIHPGSGRRRGPTTPKGRQVDPAALAEVQALLGDRERRRDLLIEHLHLLQDHFGCLHARHLVGARRGDAAGAGRGLRGRLVLRAFRHRDGRRGAAAAAHGAGLRQPDLRAVRAARSCSASCATGSATACASCGRRAWAAATRRRSSRSGTRCTRTRPSRMSPRRWRPAHASALPAYPDLDALSRGWRLYAAAEPASSGDAGRSTI